MTKDDGRKMPGSRPELAGRWGCYLCGHDQALHNNIEGCPSCKCAATMGEAGRDPSGKYRDVRPRGAGEPPLQAWQARDPLEPPAPRFETWTEYGLRIDCAKNKCPVPCAENGEVLPRREHQTVTVQRVNGHAVTAVESQVTRSPWRPR